MITTFEIIIKFEKIHIFRNHHKTSSVDENMSSRNRFLNAMPFTKCRKYNGFYYMIYTKPLCKVSFQSPVEGEKLDVGYIGK